MRNKNGRKLCELATAPPTDQRKQISQWGRVRRTEQAETANWIRKIHKL